MKHNSINSPRVHPKLSIRFFSLIILLFFSLHSFAQQGNKNHSTQNAQRKIETLKKAYISRQMNLSSKESQKFWPVYEQYQKNMRRLIHEKRQNRIQKNNLKNASNQQIKQYIDKDFKLRQQTLQLREQYRDKFRQVIPPRKVMQFYQSEKDFNTKLVKELHRRRNKKSGHLYNHPSGKKQH